MKIISCKMVIFSMVFSVLAAMAPEVWAQKSVYSFGGSCVSQGSWTQAALQHSQEMIETINALATDPNCAGLQQTVTGLSELNNDLKAHPSDKPKIERFENARENLNALAAAGSDSGIDPKSLQDAAMEEIATGGGLAMSAVTSAVGNTAVSAAAPLGVAKLIGERTRDVTVRGMEILDRLSSALPTYTKCAQNKANQGQLGTLLAATIQMAGAYSGSSSGMHGRMANTMSRLVTMIQQNHFSKAIRTLNEVQYQMSMSCLLETTSANFCAADDARKVLRMQVKEMAKANKTNGESPMEGIYLMARDLPNIAAWLKRVQFGFMPRLKSDADFKNKVVENYTSLLTAYYTIRGKFNEDVSYYRSLSDLKAKKTVLFNMLADIVSALGAGRRFSPSGGDNINFFLQVQVAEFIPFYLIGRTQIPTQVAANDEGKVIMQWDAYMKGQGNFEGAPEFQSPDALIVTIEKQLDVLLEAASRAASGYYMNFLIVDNPNLVSEVVADQNRTVLESLRRVYKFLDRLDKKIMAGAKAGAIDPLNSDFRTDLLTMRPAVAETAQKIRALIDALGRLMIHAAQTPGDLKISSTDYQKQINDLYKSVITTAFTEFNVQFQRETMLAVRMSNFVRGDFTTRVRDRAELTDEERNMMISYGRDMIDRIVQYAGFNGDYMNPQAVEVDLDTAQTVNMRNLVAFEKLFRDQLYETIMGLNKIFTVGASEVAYRNSLQKLKEKMGGTRMSQYDPVQFYFWKWAPQVGSWHVRKINGLRFGSFFEDTFGADDTEGSIEKFRARLCIQTLSFQDKARFRDICRGAQIKSVFNEIDPKRSLNANYDELYNEFTKDDRSFSQRYFGWLGKGGSTQNANKTGKNVCAWRDFNRRNLVFWLTQGTPHDNE